MTRERVPELLLERFLNGELGRKEEEAILSELGNEEGGMARLDALRTSNDEILEKYAPAGMAERIRVKAAAKRRVKTAAIAEKKRPSLFSLLRFAVPAFTAVAVLAVVGVPMIASRFQVRNGGQTVADAADTVRMKGDARLFIFSRGPDGEQAVFDGETVSAGETVQVAYQAGNEKYGMIFSIDGNGGMTLHFPYSLQGTSELVPGKKVFLKDAFTLDNSPRFEHFFLVLSKKPIDTGSVFARISDFARTSTLSAENVKSLFHDVEVISLKLVKEDRK
jgi:hypothetical protein